MTGFEDLSRVKPDMLCKPASPYIVPHLSTDDIEQGVRAGRLLRSSHLAHWGRQMIETWKSLFRRPGRLVAPQGRSPRGFRMLRPAGDQAENAT
jgi:hypothetical protein